jgi:uncharacterized membrane protein
MLLLVILFTAAGALIVCLALPLIQRRVKPNYLYGLRVPATFADEWVWYEANAASGRDLLVLGVALIAAALILPLAPGISLVSYALTVGGLLGSGAIGFAIIGWQRANRLLRLRQAELHKNA